MKSTITPAILVPILVTALLACKKEVSEPPVAVVFNDTIDWGWELGEWYGGNSFYWWHIPSNGVVDLGELGDNWKKPHDFGEGEYFLRFEVLSQPGDTDFNIQLGFWQDREKEGGHSETVSPRITVDGGPGSLVEANLGSPSEWWQRRSDSPVDFSRPADFYQAGLALWKADPLCIPMAQGWVNSNACENPAQAAAEFFPMRARVTVMAVAAGHTFPGWENVP